MEWLDALIILVLLAAVVRGLELGLVRQLFSAVGFFSGLFLGVWVNNRFFDDTSPLGSFGIMLGCAFGVLVIAEAIANTLKARIQISKLEKVDRSLGSIVAVVAIMIFVWLGASIFSSTPYPALQRQIRDSFIISRLQTAMPDAPNVITAFGHLVTPNGFPEVFTGAEPAPAEDLPIPDMGELTSAVTKTRPSVVKIEGEGCGGIVEGSGFIAAKGYVVTNAHVVAGVKQPKVISKQGSHKATVMGFNANLDIAVLRVIGLAAEPLTLGADVVADGTKAAVMGYPGGGGFQADPAVIIDSFAAAGKNIYNEGSVVRNIYSMQADVISGNSGGPVIDAHGTVIGVVFAQSLSYERVGYALTMPQVLAELDKAKQQSQAAGTGDCAQ